VTDHATVDIEYNRILTDATVASLAAPKLGDRIGSVPFNSDLASCHPQIIELISGVSRPSILVITSLGPGELLSIQTVGGKSRLPRCSGVSK
jgi:hypothetical protein